MNATAANYDLDGNVAAAASKSSDDDVVTGPQTDPYRDVVPSDTEKNEVRKKLIESIDSVLNHPHLTKGHLDLFQEQTEERRA